MSGRCNANNQLGGRRRTRRIRKSMRKSRKSRRLRRTMRGGEPATVVPGF